MAMPPAETDLKDDAIDRPLPMSNAWPGKAREFQQAGKQRNCLKRSEGATNVAS